MFKTQNFRNQIIKHFYNCSQKATKQKCHGQTTKTDNVWESVHQHDRGKVLLDLTVLVTSELFSTQLYEATKWG